MYYCFVFQILFVWPSSGLRLKRLAINYVIKLKITTNCRMVLKCNPLLSQQVANKLLGIQCLKHIINNVVSKFSTVVLGCRGREPEGIKVVCHILGSFSKILKKWGYPNSQGVTYIKSELQYPIYHHHCRYTIQIMIPNMSMESVSSFEIKKIICDYLERSM